MPKLRVEYAKSGRGKCSSSGCSQEIVKNEVRIGTAFLFPAPGGVQDEAGKERLCYKWRHLCCFTDIQLENARASGEINDIDGYSDLAPADQELVEKLKRGELVQKKSLKGRIGDFENSPLAAGLLQKGKGFAKGSTNASSSSPRKAAVKRGQIAKRSREEKEAAVREEDDSDATEEYEVVVETSKPHCPYGSNCFRTGAEHIAEYFHGTEADKASPPRLRAVIKGKKRAT
ncbi:putative Zinc-finger (CX5CX6HX5H) motif containing protein [Trypanosoma cruzi]|nr:putative Zinc-finger (CX5CX6HX5H) motif containing protein [Trypanosoma cruzi]